MKIVWILLAVLLGLGLLWLLAIFCRKKKNAFSALNAHNYAHRGLHNAKHGVPENSLLAFRLAVEHGYGAELDVHLTKDGRLAVMHDESLQRTAGIARDLCSMTADELAECLLEGTDEKVPFLEEVLPIFEGKAPLIVEIKPHKGNHAELTRRTCELLDRYPKLDYCIESFDPRVLWWLRRHRPEIVRGQLSSNFMKERSGLALITGFILTNLLTDFLTAPDFIAYNFASRRNLSLRLCRAIWRVQEFSWTIRSAEDAKTALDDNCLIIFEHCVPPEKR